MSFVSSAPWSLTEIPPQLGSPILSIGRGSAPTEGQLPTHAHPEHILLWSTSATLLVEAGSRDWLVPPGYALWVPGGVEHGGVLLHEGEMSIMTFAPDRCPIVWPGPTGISIGPLLRELIIHLDRIQPHDLSREPAETLMFSLLTPLPTQSIQIAVPADPRVRAIAEALIAEPADPRELAAWAAHVHAGARTVSRLFLSETGLSFAQWRTHVRIQAAVQLLANGTSVGATARAVGYRKPSAFINAFRRVTGQTPGTYIPVETGQALGSQAMS